MYSEFCLYKTDNEKLSIQNNKYVIIICKYILLNKKKCFGNLDFIFKNVYKCYIFCTPTTVEVRK